MAIPTTLITGILGVGKTTAVLELARHQPPGEQWAVLVNELGEVGVDGAILAGGRLEVRELAGGCLCCTARGSLRAGIAAVLARTEPQRLLIEASGVASPGAVLDTVRRNFADVLDLRATITIVDPRHLSDDRRSGQGCWRDQVEAADVLVGNKLDRCEAEEVRVFLELAAGLFPPRQRVVTTVGAELDPAWLDLPAREGQGFRWVDQTGLLPRSLAPRPSGLDALAQAPLEASGGHGLAHRGWRFAPEVRFHRALLQGLVGALAVPGPLVAEGALRLKGVVHCAEGWFAVHADIDGVSWSRSDWRGGSVLTLICASSPDWEAVEAALRACRVD